jgi:hypothetical protein
MGAYSVTCEGGEPKEGERNREQTNDGSAGEVVSPLGGGRTTRGRGYV